MNKMYHEDNKRKIILNAVFFVGDLEIQGFIWQTLPKFLLEHTLKKKNLILLWSSKQVATSKHFCKTVFVGFYLQFGVR